MDPEKSVHCGHLQSVYPAGPFQPCKEKNRRKTMCDDVFLALLRQHPELWGIVMDVLKNHSEVKKGENAL